MSRLARSAPRDPRPRDDVFGRVVANGVADSLSPARHATAPQRRLRAAASPSTRHLAPLDDARRTRPSSSTSTAAHGRSATSANRGDPCCTSSSSGVGSSWRCNYRLAPRLPVARADRGRHARARLDQEEHRDLRGRPRSRRHRRRLGRRAPGVAAGAQLPTIPTWRPEEYRTWRTGRCAARCPSMACSR